MAGAKPIDDAQFGKGVCRECKEARPPRVELPRECGTKSLAKLRTRRSFPVLTRSTGMRFSAVAVVCALTLAAPTVRAEDSRFVVSILVRAREEVARHVVYDPSYVRLAYPLGDVDSDHGVCTDVVVRALRAAGLDLQKLVHEDVLARPQAYAHYVAHPDANIDHRRVGPLVVWLNAHAQRIKDDGTPFEPGDLVVWSLRGEHGLDHIGIVSDRMGPQGRPLMIHNIGPAPTEDDVLRAWPIQGHWRLRAPAGS